MLLDIIQLTKTNWNNRNYLQKYTSELKLVH